MEAMGPAHRDSIFQHVLTPKPVTLPTGLKVGPIDCGEFFVLMVLWDASGRGHVYAAGANDIGQLGNGSRVSEEEAEKNPDLRAFQSDLRPVRSFVRSFARCPAYLRNRVHVLKCA
jgi:hypothetical protein